MAETASWASMTNLSFFFDRKTPDLNCAHSHFHNKDSISKLPLQLDVAIGSGQ